MKEEKEDVLAAIDKQDVMVVAGGTIDRMEVSVTDGVYEELHRKQD